MQYYIKTEADGFVSEAPLTEAKDGYTAVEIPVTSKEYFLRYFNKYRVVDGNVQAPANLPSLDIDSLQNIVNQQATQIEAQSKNIDGALATIKQLQDLAQTENQQQLETQKTIKQLQDLSMTLNKQNLELQGKIEALTPAKQ